MASSSSSPRRRRRPLCDPYCGDLEEGEYVPGCGGYGSSDTEDDCDGGGGGYRFQPRREAEDEEARRPEHMRPLEDIIAAVGRVRAPPPPPARSWGSDNTLSDDGNPISAASSAAAAPARTKHVCHFCGKVFASPKAVDGHMRVHGHVRQQVAAAAAVSGGWDFTGRRGWAGVKPHSSVAASVTVNNSGLTSHSTDIVVAQPLQPVPMEMAMTATGLPSMDGVAVPSAKTDLSEDESSSASAQPTAQCDVVTGAPNPSSTGPVIVHHEPATPTTRAVAEQAQQVHQPAVPLSAAQQAQLVQLPLVLPPPAVQQQGQVLVVPKAEEKSSSREYSCKLCGKSYPTPQGLGGHAAGHRNKQREAEAAAAAAGMPLEAGGALLAALHGDKEEKKTHTCTKCGKVFDRGVSLGGHMRMHYTGPPIETKRNKKMRVVAPPPVAVPPPSMKTEQPSPGAGRVRLFGVDIGPLAQASSSSDHQKGSSATEEGNEQ
ncbi:hypothetical protein BS78_03G363300 [Paspalum vaginatum]|nr:hypothetical protein BS78_03G363300 [Paspalum vaginatum]